MTTTGTPAPTREGSDLDKPGIYRMFDGNGELLYVGRTRRLAQRLNSHRREKEWWGDVASLEWVAVDNYAEAVALERDCIERENPLYNGNSGRVPQPPVKLQMPADTAAKLVALYADSETAGEAAEAFKAYAKAVHDAGWTLSAIASELGVTREAVRLRIAGADPELAATFEVPRWVRPPSKWGQRKVWPSLTEAEAAELRELALQAARCRGGMTPDHPARVASERLSELFAEYRIRGVRVREIAEAAGVVQGTVRARLQRHGYYKTPPSVEKYQGTVTKRTKTHCHRGHELAGENLRLINGDPRRRTCRECERIRGRNYLARKSAA